MNKHLFETKLKSIEHYNSEEEKLKEALKITCSVRNELVQSLLEFFPFSEGDILFNGGRVITILKINHVNYYPKRDDISFNLDISAPSRNGYLSGSNEVKNSSESMRIGEFAQWKKIN